MKKLVVCLFVATMMIAALSRPVMAQDKSAEMKALFAEEKARYDAGYYDSDNEIAIRRSMAIKNNGNAPAMSGKLLRSKLQLLSTVMRKYSEGGYCDIINSDAASIVRDIVGSGYLDGILPECVSILIEIAVETIWDCPNDCICSFDPVWCLASQYGRMQDILNLKDCM